MKKKDINHWYGRPLYKGLDIKKIATRPGCLDILAAPSRHGNVYYYPNGKIEVRHE